MADTELASVLPGERTARWPWGWAVVGFVAQGELERCGPGLHIRSLPCLTKPQFPPLENGGPDEETKHRGVN